MLDPRLHPQPAHQRRNADFRRTTPRLTTCFEDLADAIRGVGEGRLPTEAGRSSGADLAPGAAAARGLLAGCGQRSPWGAFRAREVVAVDFAAAADAVQGMLPCSDGLSELAIRVADLRRCGFCCVLVMSGG